MTLKNPCEAQELEVKRARAEWVRLSQQGQSSPTRDAKPDGEMPVRIYDAELDRQRQEAEKLAAEWKQKVDEAQKALNQCLEAHGLK